MTEQELVKRCLLDICIKNGFQPTSMSNRDYEFISNEIQNNTGTLISLSTVKRLIHGEFGRTPQTATLNAISNYLGFKNWQEYKMDNINTNVEKVSTKTFSFNIKWVGITFLFVALVVFISFITISSNPSPNYESAQFTFKKTTANNIPNTVIFNYNIDDVNADSFFIQQSWDRRRRVKIEKHNHTLTDIYYEPGYHKAKLIANDSIIKTIDVSIPTDRWFIVAKDAGSTSIPQYINESNAFKNGYLTLDSSDLDINQIKTEEPKVFIYEYFPSTIDVSSDDFIYKAKVRMRTVRNDQCPFMMCEIFCQNYFMYFQSMNKGCASEMTAQFGDHILNGKNMDLSSLCFNLDEWTDVEIKVKNKTVTIYFNTKPVYTGAYSKSSGLITGLGFISNGLCEIDFVSLKGLDNKMVYESEF